MAKFKDDVEKYLQKNNITYKKGTIERRRQDFLAWREKKLLQQQKPLKEDRQLPLF